MSRFTVRWYFAPPDDPNRADLLKTPAGKTLSDLQQEFMRGKQADWLLSPDDEDMVYDYEIMGFVGSEVPQGHKAYHAYAVNKEDAFAMAAALVEFMTEMGTEKARRGKQQHTEKLSERQRQLRATTTKAKKEATAKDNEEESAYQEYVQAVRGSLYSLHRVSDVPNALRQTILEMDKMLDVLQIEIAGIESKISAIKKYSVQNVKGQQSLKLALREMAIREEIELVGAESRRQAIMNVKERQETLHDLYEKFLALKGEAADLAVRIKGDENNIKMIEKELTRWGPRELPFRVENKNMVSIRPLRIK